jgi:WD40 repeat protein
MEVKDESVACDAGSRSRSEARAAGWLEGGPLIRPLLNIVLGYYRFSGAIVAPEPPAPAPAPEPPAPEPHHTAYISAIAALGARMITASHDCTSRVWSSGGQPVCTLRQNPAAVIAVAALDDNTVATSGNNGEVRVWNVPRGHCIQHILAAGWVRALAALPGGLLAVAAGNAVEVWRPGCEVRVGALEGHSDCVLALRVVGGRLVTASSDADLRVWNFLSAECTILRGHESTVTVLADLGQQLVASGSSDRTVRVWSITMGKCRRVLQGHNGCIRALAALGGGRLASGANDREVRVWDENGVCLFAFAGHQHTVHALAVLSGGAMLVSASYDHHEVHVWDSRTGRILHTVGLPGRRVGALAVSPDGCQVWLGLRDGGIARYA